jgi:alkylation response protein AidB-like acyl-CoA dehydrogenase
MPPDATTKKTNISTNISFDPRRIGTHSGRSDQPTGDVLQNTSDIADVRGALLDTIRRFARTVVAPRVAEYDAAEHLPHDILASMAELGLFGGTVPIEWSGNGLDHVTFAMLIEEVSRVDHTLGVLMSMPSALVGAGILQYGSQEQRTNYLEPLARGEIFGGAGVTEPRSGSDVAGTVTRFRRSAEGYVLNGQKAWITNLDIATFFLVFAMEEGQPRRSPLSAFIVPSDSIGLTRTPFKNKLGFRPLCSGELVFEDLELPHDALVGKQGDGFKIAMTSVGAGRLAVASRAVGLAAACLEEATAWARDRETFDRPIASFQQVGAKLADIAIEVQAARQLVRHCAEAIDNQAADAPVLASMAKCFASDVAQRAATQAVQIFGSNGISDETRVGRFYRDAKVFQIVEGTNEIQRNIIARSLTGIKPQ